MPPNLIPPCRPRAQPSLVRRKQGGAILERLVHHICGALGDWDTPDYVDEAVARIKAQVGTHAM